MAENTGLPGAMQTEFPASEIHRKLCLEVAWEIDAMARVLPDLVPNTDEGYGHHFLVRAMAGRLLRLSYVLMGALGDDAETTESLARIISLDGGQG